MSSADNEAKERNIRVKTWEEFKRLTMERKPKSIVYIIAKSIPARNLTSLKLIMPIENMQYIFVDFAKGDTLRQTGIPISSNKEGTRFLEEHIVKKFLKKQLGSDELKIFSYWTI